MPDCLDCRDWPGDERAVVTPDYKDRMIGQVDSIKDAGLVENIYRLESNGGRITVCLLSGDGVVLSRGVSFCSPRDQYDRKIGVYKARSRSIRALTNKRTSSPIGRRGWLNELASIFLNKSTYSPELLSNEVELVRISTEKVRKRNEVARESE